jgi:hypothetical protein
MYTMIDPCKEKAFFTFFYWGFQCWQCSSSWFYISCIGCWICVLWSSRAQQLKRTQVEYNFVPSLTVLYWITSHLLNDISMFPFRGYCIWMLFVMEERGYSGTIQYQDFPLWHYTIPRFPITISFGSLFPFFDCVPKEVPSFTINPYIFWWWQTDNPFHVSVYVEVKL